MKEDFSTRFGLLVDEYNGSSSDIAKGLQVSKQAISAWRTGARSPRAPVVESIARWFDVSVPWLMGLDVPRAPYSAAAQTAERPPSDRERLEALHQNPRLGMLFDRTARMDEDAVNVMIRVADQILKERDTDCD